ncbi:sulfite oxidase [Natrialbaceae archaeon AArc-T1-2]|uniref:sulfite oxidase n=1 Tax=Natrialbaceae archaeon AArc-T1-2 TaxID=3053904 RepID=UPI00255A9DD4|nr:sulfite oxidase [Natrialbaceae archaeon AArc-T1-2]WIV67024.1 sulfite oxidase [Natrialbaceae archaeon AArc-T1-2]
MDDDHNAERTLPTDVDKRVEEVPDPNERYTCLGPESRRVFADWLTPIENHYVLHRSNTPDLDASSWTVSLTGALDGVTLSVEELKTEYPTLTVAHTMECAGNCRAYFDPPVSSVEWGLEGVSTAVWTGASLQAVLTDHGLENEDTWVTAIGGDDPGTDGDAFARSIPTSKALKDCILAYEMNGTELPREHGAPVRLLVPGWYGVNSVKWLEELRVMDTMVYGPEWDQRRGEPYYTRWQQEGYRIVPAGEEPEPNPSVPVFDTWDQLRHDEIDHPYTFDANVKSIIAHPTGEEPVTQREDGTVEVLGVAWAGDDDVTTVEISTDGGETWETGRFLHPPVPNAWRTFRYLWEPEPGAYTLTSRATDDRGRTQPATIGSPETGLETFEDDVYPWNEGGYAANAYEPLTVDVTVRSASST